MEPPSHDGPPRAADVGSGAEVFDFRLQVEQTAALARREEHFRIMAGATFEGLALTDEGRIVALNEQLAHMLGYTEDELIGREVVALVAPEARARVTAAIRRGDQGPYTHAALRKDGTTLEVEVRARLVPAGSHTMRVTAIRDVTERHRHEIALRATLETTPHVAVQWYDAGGRVAYWNPASERMFGYRADEARGKTLDQLIHTPEEAEAFLAILQDVDRTGVVVGPAEYPFRRRDGSTGTCLSTVFAIPGPTGERCFVCMDVDISERKRAEAERATLQAQLHHAQKLEALGTLAGGIAHDFNNILGVIFVLGGVIAHDGTTSERVRRDAEDLLTAAGRARDLVKQILSFSRNSIADREPTDLAAIVREALTFLRSAWPATIEVDVALDDGVPLVLAAPAQIHQIVMNLGTNAGHAIGDEQGCIEVRLDQVVVGDEQALALALAPGAQARLTVRDTGCGMTAETLVRIFEPFFTTKGPGKGTGLGLAVVHGIVKAHGGALEVESEPGRGSVFRLYLPAAGAAVSAGAAARLEPPRGRGEHVLLVDDEPALRRSWARMLEQLGYEVTAAGDPRAALETFRSEPDRFAVVMTDLTMPHLTGVELGRRLRELRPGLPIVLASGHGEGASRDELRALGIEACLAKPLDADAVAAALRQALDAKV